jgi:hypothetical protein
VAWIPQRHEFFNNHAVAYRRVETPPTPPRPRQLTARIQQVSVGKRNSRPPTSPGGAVRRIIHGAEPAEAVNAHLRSGVVVSQLLPYEPRALPRSDMPPGLQRRAVNTGQARTTASGAGAVDMRAGQTHTPLIQSSFSWCAGGGLALQIHQLLVHAARPNGGGAYMWDVKRVAAHAGYLPFPFRQHSGWTDQRSWPRGRLAGAGGSSRQGAAHMHMHTRQAGSSTE